MGDDKSTARSVNGGEAANHLLPNYTYPCTNRFKITYSASLSLHHNTTQHDRTHQTVKHHKRNIYTTLLPTSSMFSWLLYSDAARHGTHTVVTLRYWDI